MRQPRLGGGSASARRRGLDCPPRRAASHLGEIPKCGTAQPTIFWNAGAATDPP